MVASAGLRGNDYREVVTILRERPEALLIDSAVVADLLELVDEARAAGRRVGIAVADVGSAPSDRFDAVVDSAAKLAPAFFATACKAVSAQPARTLFVDNADRAVRAARSAGLSALRYGGPDDLKYLRAVLGL
jgi:putative hydrolase of the HAD superfamily